jgi:pyrroline-5-carboxylate reductase
MAHQVCFIGAGAMGGATICGLLRETVFAPDEIVACDPAQDLLKTLSGELSIDTTADNVEGLKGARTVFLAIKPQHLEAVCAGIRPALQSDQLVISIVAGARLDTLCEYLDSTRVVRAIPNTPAQVGAGITLWTSADGVTSDDLQTTGRILGALGTELRTEDERHIDMATAVSASGPAYAFLILEAWTDAGVRIGLPRSIAERLARETLVGSMRMQEVTGSHPADLRAQVTSPGGTTAAALQAFEEGGLRASFGQAIEAAFRRSIELGD